MAIGESAPLIHDALDTAVPVHDAADMAAAVRTPSRPPRRASTVLLAPACSSFDMFRDYAERGRVFKQEVLRLQEEFERGRASK